MASARDVDQQLFRLEAAYRRSPGFASCYVQSYDPPVIALEAVDRKSAAAMRFELQLTNYPGRIEISPERPEVVLVNRS